jgi:hypothetical protein
MRSILIEAREPATLLFSDLPKALGFEVFTTKGAKASDPTGFADALNAAVLELRESLPRLRQRVADSVLAGFRYNGTAAEFRAEFTLRLRALQGRLTDPELRVFAMRVGDASLAEKEWSESVASYVMHKPIERWRDSDEDEFHARMANLAARFGRAEAAGFNGSAIDPQRQARAVRFTLTRPDGREVDQVVHWTPREDVALEETKVQLKRLLEGRGNAGMAAAAQIVWEALEGKRNEHD